MLSLKVKHLAKTRANYYCLSPPSQLLCSSSSSTLCNSYATSSSSGSGSGSFGTTTWLPSRPSTAISDLNTDLIRLRKDIMAVSFKEWFKSRQNDDFLMNQIFKILRSSNKRDQDHHHHLVDTKVCPSDDLSLSNLGLRLTEKFVLEVLRYGHRNESVLSCVKFFDWAGESGFRHTRATYTCLFKMLSKEKLMSSLLCFLERFKCRNNTNKVRFHDTLVMGYAVAGRPVTALQQFGKMRFQGLDLDSFGYHVVLNALVEQNRFDAVEVIAKQISLRGFENEITFSVMMKSFCNQKLFDEAEAYFRELVRDEKPLSGHELGLLVHALCKSNKFERASYLIEEFQDLSMAVLEDAYGVWIMDLVKAGKLDGALEFFKTKKSLDGYVPDIFRYNILICRLLRENRLMEVYDLLTEMKEGQISPDKVTMNAALCLLCKAGMVDVALDLYNSRSEFGLSPNSMAYNYLINTLCGYGSTSEAYHVLKNSIDQGYCPGRKTFSIIADALCREGNLDKMEELVFVALERNFPGDSVFSKFISAFCGARRVEHGHTIHKELNKRNKVTTKNAYFNLINGFIVEMQKKGRSFNGENAATLLSEMQKKGHMPTRKLFRSVFECICGMENPEMQFQTLLEMQLSSPEPTNCYIYNFLIDGAGHAQKPDLAKHVYDLMWSKGIKPNLSSDVLLLQSYLKNKRIFDALNFFNDLRKRRKIGRKLYRSLVVGLCKANKADTALLFMREMKENNIVPSIECYEILIQLLCLNKRYDTAVNLIYDFEKEGRQVTSFIGNVLLLHSLKSQELYKTWSRLREAQDETSGSSMLGMLIGAFCGRVTVNEHVALEEVIEKCFPLDIYTYNMLFRRPSIDREHAIELYKRMRRKGYEPNQWTIDILETRFPSCRWLDEVH